MKFPCIAVLLLSLSTAVPAADLKIGVVDMAKAFGDYHKTKAANVQFAENKRKYQDELTEMFTTANKVKQEAETLDKEARDAVLSDEIRKRKIAELQNKMNELKSLDKDIQDFRRRREEQLQRELMEQTKGLYEEISQLVNEKAKADGYDLVFDKSGKGVTFLPILLYAKDGATKDFTPEIIVELNKDAPAGAPAPASGEKPAAEEKKKGN